MPAIQKFLYILVDEDGDTFGINSEEQAQRYAQNECNVIYDVAAGTSFGSKIALLEADNIDDPEDDEDEDEDSDESEDDDSDEG